MIQPMRRTARALSVATFVAAVAVVAGGCGGGGDGETSASTAWANDLCTAISTWKSSIDQTALALTSSPSQEGLATAAADARSATQAFVETTRALGAPDTESGEEARAAVESFAASLESGVDEIEAAVRNVSGPTGIFDAIASIRQTVAQLSDDLASTVDALQGLDELQQSFLDASACEGVIPPVS
jgi:hypothetical protein